MATYAISFEIKYDSSGAWHERYDSLMAAIRKCRRVWAETTSFCVVQTDEKLEELEERLWLSKFDSTKDILLVIDVAYDAATMRGAIKDRKTLSALMYGIQSK